MLTQKDIKEIERIVDTKLEGQFEKRFKYLPAKDEFFTKMDEVMNELKKVRDSQETHAASHERINNDLDDYEGRLVRPEKHTGIAS